MRKTPLFLVMILLLAPSVLSWGPNTHLAILSKAIDDSPPSLIKEIITENLDGCYPGLVYADVGIFYYYTNFKLYSGLHNYNVVSEMLRLSKDDRDRAFAYCYKSHLAADAISHNFFIPAAIRRTRIPNYIIHPIQELKIEGFYLNPVANKLMERHKEFDSLVTQASGKDWSVDAARLNTIIGGGEFYSKAYQPDSTTFMGMFQKWGYTFLAKFVGVEKSVPYFELSIEETKAVLRGETSSLDPSGESALKKADSDSQLMLYIISFLVIIAVFWVSWKFKIIGF